MSVGGKVCAVRCLRNDEGSRPGLICVNTYDGHDYCAIHLDANYPVVVGDKLWWQGAYAYWTGALRGFEDKRIRRVGYSHKFCGVQP